jgi:hypothetical protein
LRQLTNFAPGVVRSGETIRCVGGATGAGLKLSAASQAKAAEQILWKIKGMAFCSYALLVLK